MNKPWLKSYPEGVPHEVHPEQFKSVGEFLETSFKKNASAPFSVCMDQWMTYAEVDQASASLS